MKTLSGSPSTAHPQEVNVQIPLVCFQVTTSLAQWVPVAPFLAAGVYLLFFSCSQNLFLAALLPDNLATQSTEASSAVCSKASFSRSTQRCQNHRRVVYKGQYTLHQHANQLLTLRPARVYQCKEWFLLQETNSLRPVSPQTEAEWLGSPEEKSSKMKLFQCIVTGSWKRRGVPTYGHHT